MPAKDIKMSIGRLLEVSVKRGARIDQICVYMKAQRNHKRDEWREYNVRTHFALKGWWGSCLTPAPYRYTFLILSCFDYSLLDCSYACPPSYTTWKCASKQALLPESVSLHLCVFRFTDSSSVVDFLPMKTPTQCIESCWYGCDEWFARVRWEWRF